MRGREGGGLSSFARGRGDLYMCDWGRDQVLLDDIDTSCQAIVLPTELKWKTRPGYSASSMPLKEAVFTVPSILSTGASNVADPPGGSTPWSDGPARQSARSGSGVRCHRGTASRRPRESVVLAE